MRRRLPASGRARPPARRRRRGATRRRPRLGPLRLLRHRPAVYWSAVAALALLTGGVVSSITRDADAARDAYGEVQRVAVARRTIDSGERIERDDVVWRDLPAALVAGEPPADVVDRVARHPIYEGEPIVDARLAPSGSGAVAARVPEGSQAVAVPLTVGAPAVEIGDVVDLLAIASPDPDGPNPERVARRATVVDVDEQSITVAVDDAEVRSTAFALGTGAVVIVLTSPS